MVGINVMVVDKEGKPSGKPIFIPQSQQSSKLKQSLAGKTVVYLDKNKTPLPQKFTLPDWVWIVAHPDANLWEILVHYLEEYNKSHSTKPIDPSLDEEGDEEGTEDEGEEDEGEEDEEGEGAGAGAGDGCFVAGTLVVMEDGSRKPIESVCSGDRVLSTAGQRGVPFGSRVVARETYEIRSILLFKLSNLETIGVSPKQKIVTDQGAIRAKDLSVGAQLTAISGNTATIDLIDRSETTTVHCLKLDGADHYFAGILPIQVPHYKL